MPQLKICPNCNSPSLAKIFYGMPNSDDEFNKDIEENKIVLGGSIISDNDPDYKCLVCEAFIYSKTGKYEIREEEVE